MTQYEMFSAELDELRRAFGLVQGKLDELRAQSGLSDDDSWAQALLRSKAEEIGRQYDELFGRMVKELGLVVG